ncbi:hypothetical protein ACWCW7_22515 [Nocardia tengchongensis]
MRRSVFALALGVTAAVSVPMVTAATAQAAPPNSVYFNYGGKNCAITPDGVIGCDGWQQVQVFTYTGSGVSFPVYVPAPQSIQDAAGMRPSYDFSQSFTQPGGNPDFFQVANDQGPWGPKLSYAGASCEVGFHGSFYCVARGA